MTTQNLKVSPTFFDKDRTSVIAIMRRHFEDQHAEILNEAKRALREAVRTEWCAMFEVEREERSDDEGGGSVSLTFPAGWTEDQATWFASQCLDLDLSTRYGGPGRYFQDGGVGTNDDGIVTLGMRWGLDI